MTTLRCVYKEDVTNLLLQTVFTLYAIIVKFLMSAVQPGPITSINLLHSVSYIIWLTSTVGRTLSHHKCVYSTVEFWLIGYIILK